MAQVERRCCGIDASIDTYLSGLEELVEGIAVAIDTMSACYCIAMRTTYPAISLIHPRASSSSSTLPVGSSLVACRRRRTVEKGWVAARATTDCDAHFGQTYGRAEANRDTKSRAIGTCRRCRRCSHGCRQWPKGDAAPQAADSPETPGATTPRPPPRLQENSSLVVYVRSTAWHRSIIHRKSYAILMALSQAGPLATRYTGQTSGNVQMHNIKIWPRLYL